MVARLSLYQHHPIITTVFSVLIILVSTSYGDDDNKDYTDCQKPFSCGLLPELSYPFWGGDRPEVCGHKGFELKCEEGQLPLIASDALEFRLLNLNQSSRLMALQLVNFQEYICPTQIRTNSSSDSDVHIFGYDPSLQNLNLLYNCSISSSTVLSARNRISFCNGYSGSSFYGNDDILVNSSGLDVMQCSMRIRIPIAKSFGELLVGDRAELEEVLGEGLNVSYEYDQGPSICEGCMASRGICGTNMTHPDKEFMCLCRDQPYAFVCQGTSSNAVRKILIGAGAALCSLVTMLIAFFFLYCRKKRQYESIFSRSIKSVPIFLKKKHNQDLEVFIRNHGPLALKRYNLSDVKKMTNVFKDKLGQGGYGIVYKGKLQDGHLVAVKVMQASKGDGEEFINEVASISRTSHVNIVTLLGFCLEGDKRVLLYDFMVNGSLEKFINQENALQANQQLGWDKLYQILVGVARGLEYLHRGCNTRIVHFDIKPHNILLDADFSPKISDFGLAKPCARKESNVSLLEARGTIGYIAPEVFSRNFGQVSHKSDVYSFGMMALEIVGGRKNHEAEMSSSTEKYFPDWIYRHLELDDGFELNGVTNAEQSDIVRQIAIVGLWCILTYPSDRPSMRKVIEMLEGPLGALKIPPKPRLYSPPRLLSYSSTTSLV